VNQERNSETPWTIIAAAAIMAFSLFSPIFAIPPIEHILKEELALSHAQTSLIYSGPVLMIAAIALPAGILTDRIGIRKAAGIGAIILAVGSVLRLTATSPQSLIAYSFIYGVGVGWVFPNLPKLVSLWAPKHKAVNITSIYSVALYTGPALALATTVPIMLATTGTYQVTFLVWSIPTIIAAVTWWILAREPRSHKPPGENRVSDMTKLRTVFSNGNVWLLSVIAFFYFFFYYNWSGWAPTLLLQKGASASLAGLISSITIWVGIPIVFLMPKLTSKLGLRKPLLWGSAIACIVASLLAIRISLSATWLPMVMVGIADAAMIVTILTLLVEIVDVKLVGIATGAVWAISHVGGFIGPLIGGSILDNTGSLNLSYIILAIICSALVGFAFRLPETGPKAGRKLPPYPSL
jgi:CP family cyanate transporter-like MFS transporter